MLLRGFRENGLTSVIIGLAIEIEPHAIKIRKSGTYGDWHHKIIGHQWLEEVKAIGEFFSKKLVFRAGQRLYLPGLCPSNNGIAPGATDLHPSLTFPFEQFDNFAEQQLADLLALVGRAASERHYT